MGENMVLITLLLLIRIHHSIYFIVGIFLFDFKFQHNCLRKPFFRGIDLRDSLDTSNFGILFKWFLLTMRYLTSFGTSFNTPKSHGLYRHSPVRRLFFVYIPGIPWKLRLSGSRNPSFFRLRSPMDNSWPPAIAWDSPKTRLLRRRNSRGDGDGHLYGTFSDSLHGKKTFEW